MLLLEGTMKHKIAKRSKKESRKKRTVKTHNKKNGYGKTVDLQKVVSFKFQKLSKVHEDFKEKRKKEKIKQDKLKDKNREKQIQEEQRELKQEEKQLSLQHVRIFTDSIYVKDGITVWINNWEKNNWKTADKKNVKNVDLWKKLKELVKSNKIEWNWIKGHSNEPMNDLADKLAKKATPI